MTASQIGKNKKKKRGLAVLNYHDRVAMLIDNQTEALTQPACNFKHRNADLTGLDTNYYYYYYNWIVH